MAVSLSDDSEDCDVFVVGAGLAGLAAAIDFARAGFSRRLLRRGRPARPGPHGRAARPLDRFSQGSRRLAGRRAARRADALAADRRRHRLAVPAAAGRIPRRRDRPRRIRLEHRERGARRRRSPRRPPRRRTSGASTSNVASFDFAAERGCVTPRRREAFRRRGWSSARTGAASPARQAAGIDGADASLSPERADRLPRPCAPARGFFDRIPHATGTVHPRSPARRAKRAAPAPASSGSMCTPRRSAAPRSTTTRSPARSSARRARCSARCGSRARAASSRWRARS